ncbi:phosphoesterase RecJ domain-containing protein [Pseudoflavonifractor sp. AF19-9AC]|uniref:DHH family phosphoesterase n=1 Tax=Pseudoflavonifractor sp. AF19-9AC TaxID=2292244 RepID=UPI000E472FE4|nr:DHH family phosphoesterase [Pseudoflavonifractor sp. AF19-9AC]RHR11114.1 phosphoesterase RecJ domain-containing protein [Pseudoflavonifractor sp. AF19-9AC]
MTPQQAADFLRSHDNYLILTHVRPDGDTVGCAAGLCLALRQAGKTAHALPNPETTPLFSPYLEGLLAPDSFVPHTVVSVDIAARGLFPDNAQIYLEKVDLAIDHHPSQEFFAKETCLDASRAACGELMYDIVKQFCQITPEMGTALYVAISTDCGCFQYGNTTSDTHRIAAQLIDCGIPLAQLNKRHFRTKSMKRLQLEGLIAQSMELHDNGETALAAVSLDMLAQVGADERDLEDIANFVGQVEGVYNAATLRELSPGKWKISLRTDAQRLNASHVCALLSGGGHAAAAGGMTQGTMAQAKQAVLDAIRQVKHG